MSEADNPYDNAFAESFFSRFKAELLQRGAFQSKQDAATEVFDFIEGYYNTKRLHSSIDYLTPMEFEKQYHQKAAP
jgi:transposase InsO family protein